MGFWVEIVTLVIPGFNDAASSSYGGSAEQTFAEAGCVFVGDGEDADAALRAAGFADEMVSAAMVGVGYGGVYDLDESIGHCERIWAIASDYEPSALPVGVAGH